MRSKKKIVQFPEVSKPQSKVIYFPNCEPNKTLIPIPKNASAFDKFVEFEVCGQTLESFGIFEGDLLTCRTNFSMSEITPETICIMRIFGDFLARKVTIKGKTITFNCGRKEKSHNVEFLAVAVELRKTL